MSFHETPLRRLHLVRAWGLLALAIGLGGFSFAPVVDAEGKVYCYVGAGICALMALFNFWRARRTPAEAIVTTNPDLAPVPEQIHYYRRMLWVSLIAFPGLAAFVASDLQQLESGAAERVRIWAPLVPIYERFGFWPTVLAPILLGLVCCGAFVFKLRKLQATECR